MLTDVASGTTKILKDFEGCWDNCWFGPQNQEGIRVPTPNHVKRTPGIAGQRKAGSLPRMLCVEFFHERQDQWVGLSGAEQQVPSPFATQVNAIRSLLLDVKVFYLDGFVPSVLKVLVFGLSCISYRRHVLSVGAAVLVLHMSETGVVVGVDGR